MMGPALVIFSHLIAAVALGIPIGYATEWNQPATDGFILGVITAWWLPEMISGDVDTSITAIDIIALAVFVVGYLPAMRFGRRIRQWQEAKAFRRRVQA